MTEQVNLQQMQQTNNPIVQLQIDVSRMNGMLERALTDHGMQLTRHEGEIGALQQKTSSIDSALATHTEALIGVNKDLVTSATTHARDINEMRNAQTGQLGKVMIVVGPILAGLAILISILRDVYIP